MTSRILTLSKSVSQITDPTVLQGLYVNREIQIKMQQVVDSVILTAEEDLNLPFPDGVVPLLDLFEGNIYVFLNTSHRHYELNSIEGVRRHPNARKLSMPEISALVSALDFIICCDPFLQGAYGRGTELSNALEGLDELVQQFGLATTY